MITVAIVIALASASCNGRLIGSESFSQDLNETLKVGAVEITGIIDQDCMRNSSGEISVEAYPFIVGLVRDSDQQVNAKMLLDEFLTVGEHGVRVMWNGLVGENSIRTQLSYTSSTLPGNPEVQLEGDWDYLDESKRNGRANVTISDDSGSFQLKISADLDHNGKSTLNTFLTLGPVTIAIAKDENNTFDDYVALNESIKMDNFELQLGVGAHQNPQSQRDFYLSTDFGVFRGRINVDPSANVDVTGGIKLYNSDNDGFQLAVTHYHTNENKYELAFTFWPLIGSATIDKDNSYLIEAKLDLDFVVAATKFGNSSESEFVVIVYLDPLTITAKANATDLVDLSFKVSGGAQYYLYLGTNLSGKYYVDLVVDGEPLSFTT